MTKIFGKIFFFILKTNQVTDRFRPNAVFGCTDPFLLSTAAFIRVLLQNVGADIDPILLIRRIKNGLEIPGLKDALIKILQDFKLQVTSFFSICLLRPFSQYWTAWCFLAQTSLLENCQTILNSDCDALTVKLYKARTRGHYRSSSFSIAWGFSCSIRLIFLFVYLRLDPTTTSAVYALEG